MESSAGIPLELVWSLATGGSGVAADPHLSAPRVAVGPPAAGVQESSEWFREGLGAADGPPRFLFLVGGPGGGKSQAASALVKGLVESDPRDPSLAHRTYRYETQGRHVTLINDATIATGDDGILSDIQTAIARGDHLIACINRGILVDAAHAEGALNAKEIAGWLTMSEGSQSIESIKSRDYLRFGAWVDEVGRTRALMAAVLVDTCSLLEVKPEVRRSAGDLDPQKYSVRSFAKVDRARDTPAGQLVSRVASGVIWPEVLDPDYDPVLANIESLRDMSVLDGHLRLLRGAEITRGERFTYRELWGAINRMLFGDLPLRFTPAKATAHLAEGAPAEGATPAKTFEALQRLAELRSFVGIFGGLQGPEVGSAQDPVLRLMERADPLLDATPGDGSSAGEGWSSPVLDAFTSTALGGSPLENLERELAGELTGVIQPFDRSVDIAFVELCRVAKPDQRSKATVWYGRYLTRLYAAALGIPAFRDVIDAWTRAWAKAPGLPDSLTGPFRTLLSPRRDPADRDSNPVIPLFASRTEPILGFVPEPTLALRAASFKFETRHEGESLHLHVKEDGASVGTVLLDFDLLREAMTCSDEWLGMTEARENTEPRVERFRSRRLASERLAAALKLAVEFGTRDEQITLDQD